MRRISALWAFVCFALVVSACGGGSGDESPSTADFAEACSSSGNLDPAICDCVARKAKDELSALAFSFLVATLSDDSETTQRLRPQMSATEATSAGMFMVSGPAHCTEELGL